MFHEMYPAGGGKGEEGSVNPLGSAVLSFPSVARMSGDPIVLDCGFACSALSEVIPRACCPWTFETRVRMNFLFWALSKFDVIATQHIYKTFFIYLFFATQKSRAEFSHGCPVTFGRTEEQTLHQQLIWRCCAASKAGER